MNQKSIEDMADELLRLNDEVAALKNRNAFLEARKELDDKRIWDLENLLRNK